MKNLKGLPKLISASVGSPGKARNVPADVQCIQYLFNLIIPRLGLPLQENGRCDNQLVQCITQYQFRHLKYAHPDGVVDPGRRTFNSLIEEALRVPVKQHPTLRLPTFFNAFSNKGPDMIQATVNNYLARARAIIEAERRNREQALKSTCDGGTTLSDADYQYAATQLGDGIPANLIKAFAQVESGGRSGFAPNGLPIIAFEGHWFQRLTNGKYDQTHPLLSYRYKKKPARSGSTTTRTRTKPGKPWPPPLPWTRTRRCNRPPMACSRPSASTMESAVTRTCSNLWQQ